MKSAVPAMMRAHVKDQKIVTGDGSTVGAVLQDIERQYQGFQDGVFESDGELRKFVNIYLNDEDIRYIGRLECRCNLETSSPSFRELPEGRCDGEVRDDDRSQGRAQSPPCL